MIYVITDYDIIKQQKTRQEKIRQDKARKANRLTWKGTVVDSVQSHSTVNCLQLALSTDQVQSSVTYCKMLGANNISATIRNFTNIVMFTLTRLWST